VVRNRDSRSLLLPAFDLTLTDTQGSVVARKVIDAVQLGAAQADIQAGQELALQGLLDTGTPRVDGYSIALFYP
jgi:Protein of unknown function (DUF3426)